MIFRFWFWNIHVPVRDWWNGRAGNGPLNWYWPHQRPNFPWVRRILFREDVDALRWT